MASNQTGKASKKTWLPARKPHFFKVVFSPINQGIRIPSQFMRKYGDTLEKIVLLNVPTGDSWSVQLLQVDEGTWLDKGWREFAEFYSIEKFHFLVFRYDGKSQFHVIIFDHSTTEIEYPILAAGSRSRSRVRKFDEVAQNDGDDDSVEMLEEIPAASGRKKNKLRKSENQDDQTAKEAEQVKLEKLREDVNSCPIGRRLRHRRIKTEESSEETLVLTPQSFNSSSNQTVTDKEKFTSYQRAKAFTSKNPFFIRFMQPSHVTGVFCLNIPLAFAKEFSTIDKHCYLELRVSEGTKTWPVKYRFYEVFSSAKFGHGWKDFALDNSLVVGDVCVFELIRGTEMFNITIYRKN